MATLGPVNANAVSVEDLGTLPWDSLTKALVQGDGFAAIFRNNIFRDTIVRLYLSGPTGDNKAKNQDIEPPDPAVYWTYGGSADKWSTTLTTTDLKDTAFSLIVEWTDQTDAAKTDTIRFKFNLSALPSGCPVNGITVDILVGPNNGGDFYPGIDNVRMTVDYTPAASSSSPGVSSASSASSVSSVSSASSSSSPAAASGPPGPPRVFDPPLSQAPPSSSSSSSSSSSAASPRSSVSSTFSSSVVSSVSSISSASSSSSPAAASGPPLGTLGLMGIGK